jgi:hypothetical protein
MFGLAQTRSPENEWEGRGERLEKLCVPSGPTESCFKIQEMADVRTISLPLCSYKHFISIFNFVFGSNSVTSYSGEGFESIHCSRKFNLFYLQSSSMTSVSIQTYSERHCFN